MPVTGRIEQSCNAGGRGVAIRKSLRRCEPFTSKDVACTYEFATHPDAATTTVANYATIESIDAAVYFSSDAGNPDTYAHFYADLQMFTNSGDPYPLNYMGFYASIAPDNIDQQSNGWARRNVYRWVNEEFNAVFKQAETEIDTDTQVEVFVGMNDLIGNDVCEIPLVHRSNVATHAADLEGFIPSGWVSDTWSIKHWRRT